MEVRGIVRALHSAAHRSAEAAFRDNCEQYRHVGRQSDHDGDIDLLGDRDSRRRLLARLATIAGARHLPAGAMASLAAGHFLCRGARRSGADGGVAGKQRRYQQDRP